MNCSGFAPMPVKSHTKPYAPELIKAILDAVANEDVPPVNLAELLKVEKKTITAWMKRGAVRPRRRMTDEQLDAAVNASQMGVVNDAEKTGKSIAPKFIKIDYRELTDVQLTFIEVGYELTSPAPKMHSSEEVAAFGGVLSCIERQVKYLEQTSQKAETIQEVTAAMTAAITLKQLKDVFTNPPMIDNWRDVKLIVDMTREALGMNLKVKETQVRAGVDINILGYNPNKTAEVKTKSKNVRTIDLDADSANMQI